MWALMRRRRGQDPVEEANEELSAQKDKGCIEGATDAITAPAPYLYILNRTVVANFTLRSISRCRERVGSKMQQHPTLRVAYGRGRDCNCCSLKQISKGATESHATSTILMRARNRGGRCSVAMFRRGTYTLFGL
jgi:hypothetical protein